MIDMETLDTTNRSVILSIGAVSFNSLGTGILQKLELRPTIEEQVELGRTINDKTIEWWSKQSNEAIEDSLGDQNRQSFKDCMEKLHKFCWNIKRVYSHGSVFDLMIAESAWSDLNMIPPWTYDEIRDTRTLYEVAGVSLKDSIYETKTTHRAIDDAIHQAIVAQAAFKKLYQAGMTHLK